MIACFQRSKESLVITLLPFIFGALYVFFKAPHVYGAGVDPTRPLIYSVEEPKKHIHLHGIVKKNGRFTAIINGKKRQLGELIGDVKIVHIQSNKVDLDDSGQVRSLWLRQQIK